MTKQVKCHAGKCEYTDKEDVSDECVGCDFAEEIEHDLLKKQVKG